MLENGMERSKERDNVRVVLENIGEGYYGDYTGRPDDDELLRFSVYRKPIDSNEDTYDGWVPVDDASYCTTITADTPDESLDRVLDILLYEFWNVLHSDPEASVKKLGEALSWIEVPRNRYKICFIHGYSLQYMEWEAEAVSKEEAQELFNEKFGSNFEHVFVAVYENENHIYENKEETR